MKLLLEDPSFAPAAQLAPAQIGTLKSHAEDHFQISVACASQRLAVEEAMKDGNAPVSIGTFCRAGDRMIEMAPRRPDVQVQIANLLWRLVGKYPEAARDVAVQQRIKQWTSSLNEPQFAVWMTCAVSAPPTTQPLRSRGHVLKPGEIRKNGQPAGAIHRE